MSQVQGRDRITVAREVEDEDRADWEDDGTFYEELEVFNHVSVETRHYVNSVNGHETFDPIISAGDSPDMSAPDYVTERIAEYLWAEWGIEVSELDVGIQVINVESDEFHVV